MRDEGCSPGPPPASTDLTAMPVSGVTLSSLRLPPAPACAARPALRTPQGGRLGAPQGRHSFLFFRANESSSGCLRTAVASGNLFSALTSVKPGARASLAAPSAGLRGCGAPRPAAGPHLDAGLRARAGGHLLAYSLRLLPGCPGPRRRGPAESSQAGIGDSRAAAPAPAIGPKGRRAGSDSPSPTETPSPPPPSPAGSRKGSEGEEEGQQRNRSPNALAGQRSRIVLPRVPAGPGGHILGLALGQSWLPKSGAVPLRGC